MTTDLQQVQAVVNFRVGLLQTSCTASPRAVQANHMLHCGCIPPVQLETHFLSAQSD